MPAMASITVKKADGTTDIVYDALSGGVDGQPATWRQDTGAVATLPIGLRATAALKTLWNGVKTARKGHFNYSRPYAVQNTTTSLWSSTDALKIEVNVTMPQGMPNADLAEGIHQGLNLAASTLMKSSLVAGYSPAT